MGFGDWVCPKCAGTVFASKSRCRCGGIRGSNSANGLGSVSVPRLGDWTCPKCSGNVFGSKSVCKCGGTRESNSINVSNQTSTQRPGDWICPKCSGMVFASKSVCKCGEHKPGLSVVPSVKSIDPTNPESNTSVCVICMTNVRNILLKKCGHICMCNQCVNKLVKKECPICRINFNSEDFIQIFLA
jgi:hypothetical protein